MIVSTAWLRVVCAFVAIAIGSGPNLESQSRPASGNDSIMLGAVELHLQMVELQVVKSLSAEFELREHRTAGPNSVWEVCEKGVGKATPCLGSVVFENGKLLEASRRWPQVGTPASFAKALHAIAGRLVLEGHGACRLDVIAQRDRFSTDDSTLIICGKKQIRIGFITPDPQAPAYIVEVLQDPGQ